MKQQSRRNDLKRNTLVLCGKALDTQELWDTLGEEGVEYPELERIWLMMWSYNLYLLPTPLSLESYS